MNLPLDLDHTCWQANLRSESNCPACAYFRGAADKEAAMLRPEESRQMAEEAEKIAYTVV